MVGGGVDVDDELSSASGHDVDRTEVDPHVLAHANSNGDPGKARRSLDAVTLQTHTMLIGVPVLVVVCLLTGQTAAPPPVDQWLYPIGLVALPSTGHLLVNWAHQHATLTFTSLMTLAVPVLSATGAWLSFGEPLTTMQVAGMAVVVAVLAFVVIERERGRFRTQ